MANQLWLFNAVDRADSASRCEDINKRLDVVLTDPIMTLTDGTLLYLRREQDVDYADDTEVDFVVFYCGGLYRTIIDRAT